MFWRRSGILFIVLFRFFVHSFQRFYNTKFINLYQGSINTCPKLLAGSTSPLLAVLCRRWWNRVCFHGRLRLLCSICFLNFWSPCLVGLGSWLLGFFYLRGFQRILPIFLFLFCCCYWPHCFWGWMNFWVASLRGYLWERKTKINREVWFFLCFLKQVCHQRTYHRIIFLVDLSMTLSWILFPKNQ